MSRALSPADHVAGVRAGDRRVIAKTITLLESRRADHRELGQEVLDQLMPATGGAVRVGITGPPGVGKSSFIETLGLLLVGRGLSLAVLAIDPSSPVSGGSILGDKTRMERLAREPKAFIRPTPSGGTLGGVAHRTREAMLVCEAAGFDVVIVETVGVGQSETAVAGMTDCFALLQLPNAGDDLQAIKRGVMELADMVVINKADLDPAAATRAQAQITSSLRLMQHGGHGGERDAVPWGQRVLCLSAVTGEGLAPFWQAVRSFRDQQTASGRLARRRHDQDEAWMWERIEALLHERFRAQPQVAAALPQLTADVRAGRVAASVAARRLIDLMD